MLHHMLGTVIQETFETQVGRGQAQKEKREDHRAMLIDFSIHVDHEKEEGYRHIELLIYGPSNYVQVWRRETWCVIPVDHLEGDGHGDTRVKKGKKYDEGASDWVLLSDHSSCWRDAIDRTIYDNESKMSTFGGRIGRWYQSVPFPLELEELRKDNEKARGWKKAV